MPENGMPITAVELGEILDLHPRVVLAKARRGEIPCIKLGPRIVRFIWEDVRAVMQGETRQPAA